MLRDELSPFCDDGSVIARRELALEWWTFAGLAVNQTIIQFMKPYIESPPHADNLLITLPSEIPMERLTEIIHEVRRTEYVRDWELQQPAANLLKFKDLLPEHLLRELVISRIADVPGACKILRLPVKIVNC
ncbi:MAG: hypothetical protein ACP5IL_15255 [Syntrophobacteraceae bacterium]